MSTVLTNVMLILLWGILLFWVTRPLRNVLRPAVLFSLIWLALLGMTALVPSLKLDPISVIWIQLSCCCVALGSLVVKRDSLCRRTVSTSPLMTRRVSMVLMSCLFFGTMASVVLIYDAGFGVSELLGFDRLSEIGIHYSALRYGSAEYREPVLHTALSVFIYLGGFLGGWYYAYADGKIGRIILSFSTLLPGLLVTMILTTKASFLFTCSCWVSAYLAAMVFRYGGALLRWGSQVALLLILVSLALFAYAAGHVLRAGAVSRGIETLYLSLRTAIIGSTSAFSMWLTNGNTELLLPSGYGSRTFAGPLNLLFRSGFPRFDSVAVGTGMPHEETTVHTLFRELIYDYSLLGSLLFLIALGSLAQLSYQRASRGHLVGVGILTGFYMFAVTSFMGSPFKYNTIALAWLLFVVSLRVLSAKQLARTRTDLYLAQGVRANGQEILQPGVR
jgi:oligosaccharide repeat unit polymerase